MTKIHGVCAYILLVLVCLPTFSQQSSAQDVIRVIGNHSPPARIIEGDVFSGFYFDIVLEIGRRIGADIKFIEAPFKRALFWMEQGKADVMCGPNRIPEREIYMVYTKYEFPPVTKVFLVHPDMPAIHNYQDLIGKEILFRIGNVYFDRFDKDPSLLKYPVVSYSQAIQMIHLKRGDALIIPEREGDYMMKQLGIQLKKSPYVISGRNSFITISKKSPVLKLQTRIDDTLNQMDLDGSIKEILDRYR